MGDINADQENVDLIVDAIDKNTKAIAETDTSLLAIRDVLIDVMIRLGEIRDELRTINGRVGE